jgi:hypothetical protein
MKQSPPFANLDALLQDKARLQKAIALQEAKLQRNFEQTKQDTITQLSPIHILKKILTPYFAWKTAKNNPLATFKIGYKIVGFLVKKLRSKKE